MHSCVYYLLLCIYIMSFMFTIELRYEINCCNTTIVSSNYKLFLIPCLFAMQFYLLLLMQ